MLKLVSRSYWWPGLPWYIAKFISGCDLCNHMKSFPSWKVGKLTPNKVPEQHWQTILVDIIGEFPDSKGYNAILVIVNRLLKQDHIILTVTSLDSAGVAKLFLEHIWRHHGLPDKIISDQGLAFISSFSSELANLLNSPLTAHHPQTDGQTERVNQDLEAYLHIFINT